MQEYVIYFDEEESHLANSLGMRHENSRNTEYGEVLYTARGSQGITTFGWIDDTFAVWPLLDQPDRLEAKDVGTYLMKLKLETDQY